jgi:hypothetical protein
VLDKYGASDDREGLERLIANEGGDILRLNLIDLLVYRDHLNARGLKNLFDLGDFKFVAR